MQDNKELKAALAYALCVMCVKGNNKYIITKEALDKLEEELIQDDDFSQRNVRTRLQVLVGRNLGYFKRI